MGSGSRKIRVTSGGQPTWLIVLVSVLVLCQSWLVLALVQSLITAASTDEEVGYIFWTAITITVACLLLLGRSTHSQYLRLVEGARDRRDHRENALRTDTSWIQLLTAVALVTAVLFLTRELVGFLPAVVGAFGAALVYVLTVPALIVASSKRRGDSLPGG